MITKEELSDWNSHPVTKAVMEEVNRAVDTMRERSTLRETADLTAQDTAKKEGFIEGATAFIDAFQYIEDVINE